MKAKSIRPGLLCSSEHRLLGLRGMGDFLIELKEQEISGWNEKQRQHRGNGQSRHH